MKGFRVRASGFSGLLAGAMSAAFAAGCGGDARFEMAAGDALRVVADEMEITLGEYHADVSGLDDSRESGAVSAFVTRVSADRDNPEAMESHVTDFQAALERIRADRETEWARRAVAAENVGVLREVASGLQKLAIESLTLEDEMRRYLNGWLEARRRAKTEVGQRGSPGK
jgi:hypothetical protein